MGFKVQLPSSLQFRNGFKIENLEYLDILHSCPLILPKGSPTPTPFRVSFNRQPLALYDPSFVSKDRAYRYLDTEPKSSTTV
jgi:hypothetical protein